jgi:hypothetical protein
MRRNAKLRLPFPRSKTWECGLIRTRLAGAVAVALTLVTLAPAGVSAAPLLEPVDEAVCRLIDAAARANDLPVGFMTRVIWRESSFRPAAISPKGAEGIAQFMPVTAGANGLPDPFDPAQAIPKAARLLAQLRSQFGSLGLAAAAYNAGAARVADWLRGAASLPAETLAYVRFVWFVSGDGTASSAPRRGDDCVAVVAELRDASGVGDAIDPAFAPLAPWGVQLAGNFSKPVALAEFSRAEQRDAAVIGGLRPMLIGRRLRFLGPRRYYEVRLPAATRQAAELLCRKIRGVGGACVVLRS